MKNYPVIYKQGDYPQLLGNSQTVTIASGGCFLCALSMKACFYGHLVTPPQLNTLFTTKPIYLDGDLLPDNALAQAYSDVTYLKTIDYEPIPTDLNYIATLLSDPATTLTLRINLGAGNYHFVEAAQCDGTSLHIVNPLTGKLEDFSQNYGDPVTAKLHVLVYTGPVAQTPPVSATVQPSAPLAQAFANTVTKSRNFDTIAQFLGMSNDTAITTTAGQQVVEAMKSLQDQINEDNETINTLQQKIGELSKALPIAPRTPEAPSSPQAQADPLPPTQPTIGTGQPAVATTTSTTQPQKPVTWIQQRQQANQVAQQAASGNLLTRIWKLLFY